MVNDNKLLICWYDILNVVCSALLVPMEAPKNNNPFQFGGMTLNIWIEKKLVRAVDGLTDRSNFNSFLSFRRCSQRYVHQQ